jgi:glycosyltransferase involved in cell wall biosynthesis
MPNDKVSICLPVYNGAKYLEQAIQSVLLQTHKNWELIIVDDCSTDQSAEIATKYAQQDDRIKYTKNEKNLGIFFNYNICIERSVGDFIKLFAQDDTFERQCLERLIDVLENNPNAVLVTAARAVIDANDKKVATEPFFNQTKVIPGREVITDYVKTFTYRTGTPSQVLFRKRDAGKGFDPTYYLSGDIEYFFRILEKGDYYYLNEVLVNFRRHGESATVTMLKDMSFVSDAFKLFNKYRSYLKDAEGKVPLVHKPVLENLVKKVNNALYDRKLLLDEAVFTPKSDQEDGVLDFKYPAYQLLLYASELRMELDSLHAQSIAKHAEQIEQAKLCEKLEKRIASFDAERVELAEKISQLNELVEQLYASKSWKLTEPLRKFKRTLGSSARS